MRSAGGLAINLRNPDEHRAACELYRAPPGPPFSGSRRSYTPIPSRSLHAETSVKVTTQERIGHDQALRANLTGRICKYDALNRLESGSAVISRSRLVGPAASNLILIHRV
jgi:hypothetical protein